MSTAKSVQPRRQDAGSMLSGEGDCPCERAGEKTHRPDCLYYRPPITDDLHRLIEERVRDVVSVAMVSARRELAKITPRQVFDGDDALFLSWMAGFTAGYHAANPNDKHAVDIFARCRAFSDKLAPIAGPPAGGNAS